MIYLFCILTGFSVVYLIIRPVKYAGGNILEEEFIMAKIVINPNGWCIHLTEAHLEWLHKNGHPDADRYFGNKDRSNPDLIACIEAIRAEKQPLIDEATRLQGIVSQASEACSETDAELRKLTDELLKMLDYKSHNESRIRISLRKVLQTGCWWEERIYAGPKKDISHKEVRAKFDAVTAFYNANRTKFDAVREARLALSQYCEQHGLVINHDKIEVDDDFKIMTYDETRFIAAVVHVDGETSPVGHDYESLELTEFISRKFVASCVAAGDVKGLMEYLERLQLPIGD